MIRRSAIILGLTCACPLQPGAAREATMRVRVQIPISCSIDIGDPRIVGRSIMVPIHRRCNTPHDVTVSAQYRSKLGAVTVRLGGQEFAGGREHRSLFRPVAIASEVENLTVVAERGSPEDLFTYAASINVGIAPA